MSFGEILREQPVEEEIEIRVPDKIVARDTNHINELGSYEYREEFLNLPEEDPTLFNVLLSVTNQKKDVMIEYFNFITFRKPAPPVEDRTRLRDFGRKFRASDASLFLYGAGYMHAALRESNGTNKLPKIGDELAKDFLSGKLAKEISSLSSTSSTIDKYANMEDKFESLGSLFKSVKAKYPDIYNHMARLYFAKDYPILQAGAYVVFALLKTTEEESKVSPTTIKNS